MTENIIRIVVSPTKFGIGSLRWAMEIATRHYRQLQCTGDLVLLAPRKDLKGSFLESAIEPRAVAALLKGQTVLVHECPVRLETPRTIQRSSRVEVVVVVFAHDSFVRSLDSLRSLRVTILAPEFMEEISGWAGRWNPIVEPSQYEDGR